jgi:hypothetical protein
LNRLEKERNDLDRQKNEIKDKVAPKISKDKLIELNGDLDN